MSEPKYGDKASELLDYGVLLRIRDKWFIVNADGDLDKPPVCTICGSIFHATPNCWVKSK
jgi:hypothetical protein